MKGKQWKLIGSIATGDRSIATWRYLHESKNCDTVIMLKIEDIKMAYWGDEPFCRLCERENQYLKEGGLQKSIRKCDIRDNLVQIHTYAEQMVNSGSTDNNNN